jgi:hypothetical protein
MDHCGETASGGAGDPITAAYWILIELYLVNANAHLAHLLSPGYMKS